MDSIHGLAYIRLILCFLVLSPNNVGTVPIAIKYPLILENTRMHSRIREVEVFSSIREYTTRYTGMCWNGQFSICLNIPEYAMDYVLALLEYTKNVACSFSLLQLTLVDMYMLKSFGPGRLLPLFSVFCLYHWVL